MLRLFKYLSLAFLLLAILILRPVPRATEHNIDTVSGVVVDIFEGGENDIVFKLSGNKTRYYINRGLEEGLDLHELKASLMGEEVVISYPRYWTPLDHSGKIRHLSRLIHGNDVIFNEVQHSASS